MLNDLRIQNYKRFGDLNFAGFKRVNLFTGKSNCGKTSVLEAILLLLDWKSSADEFLKVFRAGKGQQLGDEGETFWKWLFPLRNLKAKPRISGDLHGIGNYCAELQWRLENEQPKASAKMVLASHLHLLSLFVTSSHENGQELPRQTHQAVTAIAAEPRNPSQEAQDYARVVLKSGAEDQVEDMLRKIDRRLKTIRSLQPHGVPLLYAGIEGLPQRIPVIQLGHGFSRLLTIMAEIVASQKPVILIDEIENGLHHSALVEIWRGLLTACEHSDVQIFATTHSWECVAAAHEAFSESLEYPLAVFRLEEKNGDMAVIAYDKESLEYSVQQEWEVR